jgi:CheY-like chemotaxis protein
MVPATSPLTAWLDAKAAADDADRLNFSAITAFVMGTGPALAPAQWDVAARLRALAGTLLLQNPANATADTPFTNWFHAETGQLPAQQPPAVVDPDEPGQRSGSGAGSLHVHIRNDAHRKTDPASRNQNGVERSEHRVLVVDDNQAMRYATARGLRAAGFSTLEASAGAEGLALAKNASAVVLDIHLPDINGYEVCRLVRADASTAMLPIVHLSAVFVDDQSQHASADAGADAHLVAPVAAGTLAELVDQLISNAAPPPA